MPINRIRLDDVDIRNITTTTTLLSQTIENLEDQVEDIRDQVSSKINAGSPVLTGVPTTPTASVDTNTTQIANTAFVINQGYLKSSTAQSTYSPIANPIFTGSVVAGSSLTTNEVIENFVTDTTNPTGTLNIDFATSGIHNFTTTTSGNWTFNFRGSSTVSLNSYLSIGQSATVTMLMTNGATPFRATGFQIDGSAVTPRWADALAPTSGNANSTDIYTFTILKTANSTFVMLGSLARFA